MYFFNSLVKNKLDGDKYIMKKAYKIYFIFIIFTSLIASIFYYLLASNETSTETSNQNIIQTKILQ